MKIIAECCQNHNGSMYLLRKMVEEASLCGASHIKMQTIFARNLTFRPEFESGFVNSQGVIQSVRRPFDLEKHRLAKLELSWDDHREFIAYAYDCGLEPLTTCFTHDTLENIARCGFREIKIASYDCSSFALIKRAQKEFDHVYISTGATFDDEIDYLSSLLTDKTTLMHCVTQYPLVTENANMARLEWLRSYTSSVGYSDHSPDQIETPSLPLFLAVALDAVAIEAHFTLLSPPETKDGLVSIGPVSLKKLRAFSQLGKNQMYEYIEKLYPDWNSAIGTPSRPLSHQELINRHYYKGRFSSPRPMYGQDSVGSSIMNWEPWSE